MTKHTSSSGHNDADRDGIEIKDSHMSSIIREIEQRRDLARQKKTTINTNNRKGKLQMLELNSFILGLNEALIIITKEATINCL